MHIKMMTAALAVSAFSLLPFVPFEGLSDGGAAYAKSGNGNGNGGNGNGGNGNSGNGNSGSKSSGKSSNGSTKKASNSTNKPVKKKSPKGSEVEDTSVAGAEGLSPSELGKMNGAMHASITAVLAHIRNGQTTNGPVGLLAGLAVADNGAAAAAATAEELNLLSEDFAALDSALSEMGFSSVEEYLAAVADGTADEEQMAKIGPLIDAVGGVSEDGTTLAQTAPTEEEVAAANDAADAAAADVLAAEQAIGDAWNKDGDLTVLLGELRGKLAPYQDMISATIAGMTEEVAPDGTSSTDTETDAEL